MCVIKMDTDTKQTNGKRRLFCTLGVMKRRENIKVAIRPMLASYHLHDIPNLHIKFDNNQFGSFGVYLSNKSHR